MYSCTIAMHIACYILATSFSVHYNIYIYIFTVICNSPFFHQDSYNCKINALHVVEFTSKFNIKYHESYTGGGSMTSRERAKHSNGSLKQGVWGEGQATQKFSIRCFLQSIETPLMQELYRHC